jgi:hypothetical protein
VSRVYVKSWQITSGWPLCCRGFHYAWLPIQRRGKVWVEFRGVTPNIITLVIEEARLPRWLTRLTAWYTKWAASRVYLGRVPCPLCVVRGCE